MNNDQSEQDKEPLTPGERCYQAFKDYEAVRNKEKKGTATPEEIETTWRRLREAIEEVQRIERTGGDTAAVTPSDRSPKKQFQDQEAAEYDPYDHETLANEPN